MVDSSENKRVPSGSESMASMRLLITAYLGDLAYPQKSILRTRSISSKAEETVCKESDSPIVPMKPVMTVEGRGGHINRSEDETFTALEAERKWEVSTKE